MPSFSDDYGFLRRGGVGNLLGSTYFGVWVSHVMMMIVVLMINENKLNDNYDRTEGTNSLFKC
jgi:hypothetical protein